MADASQLSGKVAVVTGGSRGIGFAIAEGLVLLGTDVVICGRSVEVLSVARNRLTAPAADRPVTQGHVECVQADVGKVEDCLRVIHTAVESFGGLDILVNNAGVGHFGELSEQSVNDYREVVETNLNGTFYCCKAAIPALRRRGGGWIINISSLAGTHPFASGAAYCASKAGVNALTEALMQELRYDGIRVSCVAPGSVGTGFVGERKEAAPWKLAVSDVSQVVIDLLCHDPRSLPSRVEIRPSKPQK